MPTTPEPPRFPTRAWPPSAPVRRSGWRHLLAAFASLLVTGVASPGQTYEMALLEPPGSDPGPRPSPGAIFPISINNRGEILCDDTDEHRDTTGQKGAWIARWHPDAGSQLRYRRLVASVPKPSGKFLWGRSELRLVALNDEGVAAGWEEYFGLDVIGDAFSHTVEDIRDAGIYPDLVVVDPDATSPRRLGVNRYPQYLSRTNEPFYFNAGLHGLDNAGRLYGTIDLLQPGITGLRQRVHNLLFGDVSGAFRLVPIPGPHGIGFADVNRRGTALGWFGSTNLGLWDGGPRDLATVLGYRGDGVFGQVRLNDHGEMTGTLTEGVTNRLFLHLPRNAYGLPAGFHVLANAVGRGIVVLDFSDAGAILWYTTGPSSDLLLWSDRQSVPIRDLLPESAPWVPTPIVPGNALRWSLNDRGWIAGWAVPRAGGALRPMVMRPALDLEVVLATNQVRVNETFQLTVRARNHTASALTMNLPSGIQFRGDARFQVVSGPLPGPNVALPPFGLAEIHHHIRATNLGTARWFSRVRAVGGGVTLLSRTNHSDFLRVAGDGDLILLGEAEASPDPTQDNLYQSIPGDPQRRRQAVARRQIAGYKLVVQNDGTVPRVYRLRASEEPGSGWNNPAYTFGGSDVSASLRSASGLTLPELPPRGTHELLFQLSPTEAADGDHYRGTLTLLGPGTANATLDVVEWISESLDDLVVNVTGDDEDPDPSDGILDVDPAKPGAQVTLRAALQHAESAARPGFDTIRFNLPSTGEGLPRISPTRPLPVIREGLEIDGTSQPGGLVHLSGAELGEADGLHSQANRFAALGLVMTSFRGAGLRIEGATSVRLVGNVIGTDLSGAAGLGNVDGIFIDRSTNVTVGGESDALRNVIAGNTRSNLRLLRSRAVSVGANLVGTDPSGRRSLPSPTGILAEDTAFLRIGSPAWTTVIHGDTAVRLSKIDGSSAIVASHIGVDAEGRRPLEGLTTGVRIEDSIGFRLGPIQPGADNLVGGAASNAVEIVRSINTVLSGTRIGLGHDPESPLPNQGHGLVLLGDLRTQIGTLVDIPVILGNSLGGLLAQASRETQIGRLLAGIHPESGKAQPIRTFGIRAEGVSNLLFRLVPGLQAPSAPAAVIGHCSNGVELVQTRNARLAHVHIGTGDDLVTSGATAHPNLGAGLVLEDDQGTQLGESAGPVVVSANGQGGLHAIGSRDLAIRALRAGTSGGFLLRSILNSGANLVLANVSNAVIAPLRSLENPDLLFVPGPFHNLLVRDSQAVRISGAVLGPLPDSPPATGSAANGILIDETSRDITVGGELPGDGNVIHGHSGHGIQIQGTNLATYLLGNLIYSNLLRTIQRGVPAGHGSAITNAFHGSTHSQGTVTGVPGRPLRLEFFAYRGTPTPASSHAERFLGALNVTPDASGKALFHAEFPNRLPAGWFVATTTTDPLTGTSELTAGQPLLPAPDSDGDGLPDYWEARYPGCLDPAVADPPDEDCDGDGFTNQQEYLADTHPAQADSALRLDSTRVTALGEIDCPAVPSRQYGLERAEDPSAGPWTRVLTVRPGASGTLRLRDPDPPETRAFYRVVAEPWE